MVPPSLWFSLDIAEPRLFFVFVQLAPGSRPSTLQGQADSAVSSSILCMSFPGTHGGSSSRKRPLEAQDEGETAAGSPSNFPRFEPPPPAPTTGAESSNNDDRDPYGEDSDIFDEANLPNDTMATVLALQREFYVDGKNSASGARPSGERTGVVLQHQM